MTCSGTANNCPSYLSLKSEVVSSSGECMVAKAGDRHVVSAENRSNLPYVIEVEAQCISPSVRYEAAAAAGPQADWKTSFPVPPRPGKRPGSPTGADCKLTSLGSANFQNIETKLTWKVVGYSASNTETITAQVTTQ